MSMGRMEYWLAVIAVLCVLTIFFFPAMEGPYPVVHGPVTALLSIRAAAALRARIMRGGLSALRNRLHRAFVSMTLLFWAPISTVEFQVDDLLAGCNSILRC